jgi:hypothetical protein
LKEPCTEDGKREYYIGYQFESSDTNTPGIYIGQFKLNVFDEDNYRVVGRRTGRIYTLGDKVTIKVRRADLVKKQLDFEFVSGVPSTKEVEIRNPKRYKKRR